MQSKDTAPLPKYKYGSEKKGKVMIAVFPDRDKLGGEHEVALNKEKEKIESLFQTLGYEPHDWGSFDMKRAKKGKFFSAIEKVAKDLPESETFAMVIICAQEKGKLRLTTRESFDMESIYLKFDATSCPNMICKPKFFVFHTFPYQEASSTPPQAYLASGMTAKEPPSVVPALPVTVPLEADMLVLYSYEDYLENGIPKRTSYFIEVLAQVLTDDFKRENGHKEILELMVDVGDEFYKKNGSDKPIPIVLSTLNSCYYLKKNVKETENN